MSYDSEESVSELCKSTFDHLKRCGFLDLHAQPANTRIVVTTHRKQLEVIEFVLHDPPSGSVTVTDENGTVAGVLVGCTARIGGEPLRGQLRILHGLVYEVSGQVIEIKNAIGEVSIQTPGMTEPYKLWNDSK
jgi:hypothetical protein